MSQKLRSGTPRTNIDSIPGQKSVTRKLEKIAPKKNVENLKLKPVKPVQPTTPVQVLKTPGNDKIKRRQRSASSPSEKEPWSNLLVTNRSCDKLSTFSGFDPLRTLHFLAKELQFRLQNTLPEDHSIQQMVYDIQFALKRVPPEVSSMIRIKENSDMLLKKYDSSKSLNNADCEKILNLITDNKYCQTPPNLTEDDTERIRRIVEKNTIKLETSCKELEKLCENLQKEKRFLEAQIRHEKEASKCVQSQYKESERKLDDVLHGDLKKLQEENNKLKLDLNSLTYELEQSKVSIHKSHKQSDYNLKNQITILEMEKEKYVTMLDMRNKQIFELFQEIAIYRGENKRNLEKLQGEFVSFIDDKENVGDATISSVDSHDINVFKELAGGDELEGSGMLKVTSDNIEI